MKSTLTLEKKYDYYEKSVQNAEGEVEYMQKEFQRYYGHKAYVLREDFCGTGAISCAWVADDKRAEAYGIDLDPEPIAMGKERHYSKLTKAQQTRMQYLQQNVLTAKTPKIDVICAFNFSYFIFRSRKDLLQYFKAVRKSLNKQGIFFIDLFGGPESQKLVTDTKKIGKLTYYWECQHFNPLSQDCTFAIHFRDEKGKKHENVFTYHWRLWTMPELRDLLTEAGFAKVVPYWEGDDDDGGGNGEFEPTTEVENCDAWVCYLAALT